MLFNSNRFLVFFAVFVILYFLVQRSLGLRNVLVVVASYIFYSFWDLRFTALLFATCSVDYVVARLIERAGSGGKRRALLVVSIVSNLGVLGFFKYFDFFSEGLDPVL